MKSLRIYKKNLEIISEFNKVTAFKINLQKSIRFLYTSKENMNTKTKIKITFMITQDNVKYLGVSLTKYIQDLYAKK